MQFMNKIEIEDLSKGYIIDYEHIPYEVDTIIASGDLLLTPIGHDWKPESANIVEIEGIEITNAFLIENGFIFIKDGIYEFCSALEYDINKKTLRSCATKERYPKLIQYVHEMQRAFWEIGQKHKKFKFKSEYYKGNNNGLVI